MDDGLFDCLENVDFIQVAKGNPAYYSEFGIYIMQMEALHVCRRQEFVNNRKEYVYVPGCS